MRKLSILFVLGFLCGMATACTGKATASTPVKKTEDAGTAISMADTPTPPSIEAVVSVTRTAARSATPTLAPDAWHSMPVIPAVGDTTRRIYQTGLLLHNDPHAFSILGDCLSLPNSLFKNFGKDPEHYNLGNFTDLQPVLDWFHDSFNRQSISLGNGFTSAAVLSPLMNDPKQCQGDETPMACEYRVHHPSYALIALGTDDYKSTPDAYEARMRQIVEYTISKGIIPILRTKADNREGNDAFNKVLARLAYDYDIPLWNFWAAVQPLPYGLSDDQGHLAWADPNHFEYANSMEVAVPVYNLTALQTLDAVWRGVTAP
jgi:hypothetical protein